MQARNSFGGRSLGPPKRPSSISNENAGDIRFSSTKKRSTSKTRSSSVRTPLSQSVNRHLLNSCGNGSTTKTRGSLIPSGESRALKDNRPLRDKGWQMEQVKSLLDFLRDNNYPNRELTTKHFPLSANEFRAVFNFLYGILSPSFRLPLKFESDIIALLKALDYPGNISKSTFVTIGSLHSWPSILGVILFIKDMAAYSLERRKQTFFYKEDDSGTPGEDVESRLLFEFYTDTYIKFMEGQNDFEQDIKALKTQLLHHLDLSPSKLLKLKEERNQLKATLDGIKSETGQLESLRNKKNLLNKDYEYMEDYKRKYVEYAKKKSLELKNVLKKNEVLMDEIKSLENTIDMSEHSALQENNQAKIDSLENICANISNEIRKVDEDICDIEIKSSKLKAKCDTAVQEFNMIIEELDCPSLEKISKIEDFNEEYQFRLIDSSSAASKDLRQAQSEAEDCASQLSKLKADILARKTESNHLTKALDLQKLEIQNALRNVKEEENAIDLKILSLKEEIVRLQSENQPPQVTALSKEMNDLERVRNIKKERLDQRFAEVKDFIDKARELSKSYILKVKDVKAYEIQEKLEAAKAFNTKGEKLNRQLEKHLKYLQDKERSSH